MAAGATATMFGTRRCGTTTGVAWHRAAVAGSDGGSEDRKFLHQFLCAALRASGLTLPLGRADKLLKIFHALRTMKFVEWHSVILFGFGGLSSSDLPEF